MIKKLMVVAVAGVFGLLAGCATQSGAEMRNPPAGKIAQHIDSFKGVPTWQIVQPNAAACQKFVSLFDSKPEVLKFAVDCWGDADNETAKLPVKLAVMDKASGTKLQLETADPVACAHAATVLKDVGYTLVDQCPAIPEPAKK